MNLYTHFPLSPQELERVWGLLSSIPEVVEDYTKEDFRFALGNGRIQLWTFPQALKAEVVMVTEVRVLPRTKVLMILALAGRAHDKAGNPRLGTVADWAKLNGCTRIDAWCGESQLRLFKRDGFYKKSNVISMELRDDSRTH